MLAWNVARSGKSNNAGIGACQHGEALPGFTTRPHAAEHPTNDDPVINPGWLFTPWCWRMAWRDSRKARGRLLMFSLTIMAGLAALVVMGSLRDGLLSAMEREARGMLGADVLVQSQRAFSEGAEAMLSGKALKVLREDCLSGMVTAGESKESRLVQLRGLERGFPLYGTVTTDPPEALEQCLEVKGFVAGPALMEELRARPGMTLKAGDVELPLLGVLVRPPPQVNLLGAFAPELFVAMEHSAASGWRGGIRLQTYRRWVTYPESFDTEKYWNGKRKRELRAEGGRVETLESRKEKARRVLEIVHTFLSLVAFTALVLGGLGVAGTMHVHATERLPSVATLRCLGAGASQAMSIYVLQGIWLAAAGAAGGVLLGAAILPVVPWAIHRWVPVLQLEAPLSWHHAGIAAGFGFLLCVCFSLLPLLRVRRVPAMAAVREDILPSGNAWSDPLRWLLLLTAAGAVYLLAVQLSPPEEPAFGISLAVALGVALLQLSLTGLLLMRVLRMLIRPSWPFTMRQGAAALFRPRNQTLLYILSGGLGVLLITMTLLMEQLLSRFMDKSLRIPVNFAAMEVKPEKLEAITAVLRQGGAGNIISATAVALQVSGIQGRNRLQILEDNDKLKRKKDGVTGFALGNTWRSSVWLEAPPFRPGAPFPASLEEGLCHDLKVGVGEEVAFTAGETQIRCVVAARHKASWENMLNSFPVLLPAAALKGAGGSGIVVARTADAAMGARLQRAVVEAAPGAAVIDMASLTAVLDRILQGAGWVVRGLSFSIALAGLLVLVAVLAAGRRERVRESLLLRTLGASRSSIQRILMWEYVLMGLTAGAAGASLALLAAWLLSRYLFKVPFDISLWPAATGIAGMAGLSALLGWLLSRGILSRPPADILRGSV